MSFFNGSALAVMVKSMFPSIFQRVEELEADGTIDKVNDLLKTLSANGTFEALKELALKIDRHNELLERIADGSSFPRSGFDIARHGGIEPAGLLEAAGTD